MERNWYAVYTKAQREKKVCSILTNKGIENYCPINNLIKQPYSNNKKVVLQPLFDCYVFVYMAKCELDLLNKISGISLIYWMSEPATIQHEEIEAIKSLTANYVNIKLEKSTVIIGEAPRVIEEPILAFKENSFSVKYNTIKINLPSLGYTMIAERIKSKEHREILTTESDTVSFFPKKFNSLFTN